MTRKYQVLTDDSAEGLASKVEKLLGEGWQLSGGVALSASMATNPLSRSVDDDQYEVVLYAQALTRNDVGN